MIINGPYIRKKSLINLPNLLADFDNNFSRNGGRIHWVNTEEEACEEVLNILEFHKVKSVVKTHSTTIEELGIIPFLETKNIKITEVEVGDYVCQKADERVSDIRHSAIHLSESDVATIFHEKLGTVKDLKSKQLVGCARKALHKKLLSTDVILTGANFLCADSGCVALSEDEGEITKTLTNAKIHIIVAGIDKIISSTESLSELWPLVGIDERNRDVTSYNSLLYGSGCGLDKRVHLVIVDAGRTKILSKKVQRSILTCIGCGRCARVCPIYEIIGGHKYQNAYPGPVGTIRMPIIKGFEKYNDMTTMCTLCNRCVNVCPMKIPLVDIIRQNRFDMMEFEESLYPKRSVLRKILSHFRDRKTMDKMSLFDRMELRLQLKHVWGDSHEMPDFTTKPFSVQYREEHGME